jgi:hypothetical protein
VFLNKAVLEYLKKNIGSKDMLIQTEGMDDSNHCHDVCSGFMFIQSNATTRRLFDPDNVEKYRNMVGWDDQVYINEIKRKLNYQKLPVALFPNGRYFYANHRSLKPHLIHFNWCVGHKKKEKMKAHGYWYL